jgi:hypothetical protein
MCVLKISFSRNNFMKINFISLISGSTKNLKKYQQILKQIFCYFLLIFVTFCWFFKVFTGQFVTFC